MCVGGAPTKFWAGAMLDDPEWREKYMVPSTSSAAPLDPSVPIRVEELIKTVLPSLRNPPTGINSRIANGDTKRDGRPYPRPKFEDDPVDDHYEGEWPPPPPDHTIPTPSNLNSFSDQDDSKSERIEVDGPADDCSYGGSPEPDGGERGRARVVRETPSMRGSLPSPGFHTLKEMISTLEDSDLDLRRAIEANGLAKSLARQEMLDVRNQVDKGDALLASRFVTSIEQQSKTLKDLRSTVDALDLRLQSLEALKPRLHQLEAAVGTVSSEYSAGHDKQHAMQKTIEK
jgi:hypothetical protein